VYRPPLDPYDVGALVSCLALFGLAFLVCPVEPSRVVFVLMARVVSLAWMAFLLQRWMFAGE
jgi:hypothetical protein